jgi:hypothetical protein
MSLWVIAYWPIAFLSLINGSSMSDGNDGNDELAVVDLFDGAVIADANAPGVAAF